MDERRLRIRVGIVVFAAVIVTLILVVLFGLKPQFLQPQYSVKIGFPRAPGVSRDTPVRKDGVPIGRVADVMLRDEGGVVLTMRIDEGRKLRMSEKARISMGSLVTGDAVVEFVLDVSDPNNQLIEDGDYLPNHGAVAGDPLQIMVDLEDRMTDAFESIRQAGQSMSTAFSKIEKQMDSAFDEEQVVRIAEGLESALNSFTDVMMAVEDLVGDPQLAADVKSLVADAGPVLKEARTTLEQFQSVAMSFADVGDGVRRNLDNIEELTEPLGKKGGELIGKLENTVVNADHLIEELVVLSKRVNAGEGTLGRLTTDEQLYEQISRTMINIEYLSKRLRPIMDDVRIITDKVARDPSQMGVRGLLDGNLGGLKQKYPR